MMTRASCNGASVVIAGGGTGGHLFPGLAVVEELRRRLRVDVHFVGTSRGIEARLLPGRGESLTTLPVAPLKGRSALGLAQSVARLPVATARAAALLRRQGADLVLGVGGYASGPVLAAAAAMGIPTALLEQNARLGLTNRMLAPLVGRGYLTFAETAAPFGARARVVGNPVRRELVEVARRAVADPVGFEARARTILVLGGSQGAKPLNEAIPAALARLGLRGQSVKVVHQTGEAMRAEVEARYRALGVRAEVVGFIDDMARAYEGAAMVIARAGATTLAELCAVGRPSVLIPYPFAADDHQSKNAESLEASGAAVCLPQDQLHVESLADALSALWNDDARRREMAEAARRWGRPEAAAAIVDDLLEWLSWSPAAEPFVGGGQEEPADPNRVERRRAPEGLRGPGYAPVMARRSARPTRRPLVFEGSTLWA